MACNVSCKKVIHGGLAAGVFFNLCDFIGHGFVLMPRYTALGEMGLLFNEPKIPYMPLAIVLNFVLATMAVWCYAAMRDTLGAGIKTALKVGTVLGLICALPHALTDIAWSPIGKFVPTLTALIILIQFKFGTTIGAAIYRPSTSPIDR